MNKIYIVLAILIGLCFIVTTVSILIAKWAFNKQKEQKELINSYEKSVSAYSAYITKIGEIDDWKKEQIQSSTENAINNIINFNNSRVQNNSTN